MNSYELSKMFFDWSYENPDKISPNHVALYFFIIEHNNRLGWKEKFGLPMQMAMDAIGIKNYRTWSKSFNDLVDWGFIKVHQRSKNQYSANVIALVKNTKATTKALSKAMQKHNQKQVHDIVCIDKPNNQEPITLEPNNGSVIKETGEIVNFFHIRDYFNPPYQSLHEDFKELYTEQQYNTYKEFLNMFNKFAPKISKTEFVYPKEFFSQVLKNSNMNEIQFGVNKMFELGFKQDMDMTLRLISCMNMKYSQNGNGTGKNKDGTITIKDHDDLKSHYGKPQSFR